MKKIYIYSIILSILAFASPLYGNVIDYKKNGDWESGFVNDYESVTLTQNNVGVQFGITSKKNLCFIEAFKLFIPKFDERIENSNSGFLRIDKNDIYIYLHINM